MLTTVKIDNRMNVFLGIPDGSGKKPVVIHLHERYGIVEHTTDLGRVRERRLCDHRSRLFLPLHR